MPMADDDLRLVLDASPLIEKLESIAVAASFSPTLMDQLERLIQSVYIQQESDPENHCLTLYVDMVLPSDTRPLH